MLQLHLVQKHRRAELIDVIEDLVRRLQLALDLLARGVQRVHPQRQVLVAVDLVVVEQIRVGVELLALEKLFLVEQVRNVGFLVLVRLQGELPTR